MQTQVLFGFITVTKLDTHGVGHLEMLREKWNVLMPTNKKLRAEIAKHYREEFKKMKEDETYEPVSYN